MLCQAPECQLNIYLHWPPLPQSLDLLLRPNSFYMTRDCAVQLFPCNPGLLGIMAASELRAYRGARLSRTLRHMAREQQLPLHLLAAARVAAAQPASYYPTTVRHLLTSQTCSMVPELCSLVQSAAAWQSAC